MRISWEKFCGAEADSPGGYYLLTLEKRMQPWWAVAPSHLDPHGINAPPTNRGSVFFDNEFEARVYWATMPGHWLWVRRKGSGWTRDH